MNKPSKQEELADKGRLTERTNKKTNSGFGIADELLLQTVFVSMSNVFFAAHGLSVYSKEPCALT